MAHSYTTAKAAAPLLLTAGSEPKVAPLAAVPLSGWLLIFPEVRVRFVKGKIWVVRLRE